MREKGIENPLILVKLKMRKAIEMGELIQGHRGNCVTAEQGAEKMMLFRDNTGSNLAQALT